LLGRVGDDDPPGAALLPVLDPLDDHPVVQRTNAHRHVANPPITVNVNRTPAGMPAVAARRYNRPASSQGPAGAESPTADRRRPEANCHTPGRSRAESLHGFSLGPAWLGRPAESR